MTKEEAEAQIIFSLLLLVIVADNSISECIFIILYFGFLLSPPLHIQAYSNTTQSYLPLNFKAYECDKAIKI